MYLSYGNKKKNDIIIMYMYMHIHGTTHVLEVDKCFMTLCQCVVVSSINSTNRG